MFWEAEKDEFVIATAIAYVRLLLMTLSLQNVDALFLIWIREVHG
jgi:hypothetical protein